jgi:Fe-S cluster biogenesis protein NfuA
MNNGGGYAHPHLTFGSKPYIFPRRQAMTMKEKIEAAIEKIRPMLKADGGDVELVNVTEDGVVQVRLQGACSGCPMSQMTLKNGIERIVKENVPEVKSVEAV